MGVGRGTYPYLFKLPKAEPEVFQPPKVCSRPGCNGRHFKLLQEVPKPLQDTQYSEVWARAVSLSQLRSHLSRLSGWRVTGALYLLGLGYGAVSLLLEALGVFMSKTMVYYTSSAQPGMCLG